MDEKTILQSALSGMFSMTDGEVASLLYNEDGTINESAVESILEKNRDKIKRITSDNGKKFDDGYSKGKKETAERFEQRFKEITGFSKDATNFDELVSEYIKTSKSNVKISDDDIRKHPLFLEIEKSRIPVQDFEKLKEEYEAYKNQVQRSQIYGNVKNSAWEIVAKMNPVMSENPVVAETRRQDFLSKLDGFEYEINSGNILPVKDGKRLEDAHGNAITFEAHIKDLAQKNFDFSKQTPKGNAGNDPGGKDFKVPTTEAEYKQAILNAKTAEERIRIKKEYEAVNNG